MQFVCPRGLREKLPSLLAERGYQLQPLHRKAIHSEGVTISSLRYKDGDAEVQIDIVTPDGFHDCFVVVAAATARKLVPLPVPVREKRLLKKAAALLNRNGAVRCVIEED